ncbi:MAG: SDR family NAD(P)-dependent oxidoreductase [Candidatus Dormibacteria bacterium]
MSARGTVRIRGATALVTGAGGGIGGALAVRLAREGARRLVLVDLDEGRLHYTARAVAAAGAEPLVRCTDVSSAAQMEALAAWVDATLGVADIIVNNAGVGVAGPFLHTPLADLERVVAVNLWGVVHGCRLFGARLAARGSGGHIVNVASAAAFAPSAILPAYGMTKAAVLMLSECLRIELAPQGVGVTAVCPGIVTTDIVHRAVYVGRDEADTDARRRASRRIYRLRRYPPERVAARVVAGIRHNDAVVPVTAEAHMLRTLSRLAPGLGRRLAAGLSL